MTLMFPPDPAVEPVRPPPVRDYTAPNAKGLRPSAYQAAVYRNVAEGDGNLLIDAKAGSGKTTTIVNALEFIPADRRVLFVCFNKLIATELARRVPKHVEAATLNSFGFKLCRSAWRGVQMDEYKTANTIKYKFFDQDTEDGRLKCKAVTPSMVRLVSLMKAQGFSAMPIIDDVYELAAKYEIDIPNGEAGVEPAEYFNVLGRAYDRIINNTRLIDFDDQVALPVIHGVTGRPYDFVFTDEAQDLSPVQIDLVRLAAGKTGRLVFVGDRNQAIYGFRGADPDAIDKIVARTGAAELPLSICYRCPTAVIAEAQKIVPTIEAAPGAAEGKVETAKADDFRLRAEGGDMVLCRTTAPLVAECLQFIRRGRKAFVRGRDIGRNLTALADQINTARGNVGAAPMSEKVERFRADKAEKLGRNERRQNELQALHDKCDTFQAILADLDEDTYAALARRIEEIFSDADAGNSVMFSTAHKAKGLEARRVWIICPELMPHPLARQDWQRVQEDNLKYVAVTRALAELYWVEGVGDGKGGKPKKQTKPAEPAAEAA